MFIDSHSHFNLCLEDDVLTEEQILTSLTDKNIKYAVQVSIETSGYEWSYKFAKNNKNILFTLGIHPSSKADDNEFNKFSDFLDIILNNNDRNKLFGIGETGLDYYRMRQPKEMQIHSFEYQLDISKKYNLPVIIHSRDSGNDILMILKQKLPKSAIIHCFSSNSKLAKKYIDMGYMISFAGNLTYKNADDLRDAASYVPLDRLLLETDAPFLTPVPMRGKHNRSEYIIHTYNFIAELRHEKLTKIVDNVYNNFLSINPLIEQ